MSASNAVLQEIPFNPALIEGESDIVSTQTDQLVESRMKKLTPYMEKFTQWCDKTGAEFRPQTLIDWDQTYNNGKIDALLGTDEERRQAGTRAFYCRLFYIYYRVRISVTQKPITLGTKEYVPDSKKTTMILSQVQKGSFLPKMGADERKVLIDRALGELRSAANRLTFLQYPLESIHAAVDEAVNGMVQ